jgi:hypothetical protein
VVQLCAKEIIRNRELDMRDAVFETRFQGFGSDKEPKINLCGCRETAQRDDEESIKRIAN